MFTNQFPHSQFNEVQNQQNNVDDEEDKVDAANISESSFPKARFATIPICAQERWDDESEDDLGDLDDAAVGSEIVSVETHSSRCLLGKRERESSKI